MALHARLTEAVRANVTADRLDAKPLAVREVVDTPFHELSPTGLVVTERVDRGDPDLAMDPKEVVLNAGSRDPTP